MLVRSDKVLPICFASEAVRSTFAKDRVRQAARLTNIKIDRKNGDARQ